MPSGTLASCRTVRPVVVMAKSRWPFSSVVSVLFRMAGVKQDYFSAKAKLERTKTRTARTVGIRAVPNGNFA